MDDDSHFNYAIFNNNVIFLKNMHAGKLNCFFIDKPKQKMLKRNKQQ